MTSRWSCGALLFDLDGVLADSTALVEKVWRAWARERRLDGDEVMAVAHGRRAEEVVRSVAPHLATEQEVAFLEDREASTAGIRAIAGARALVTSLPERSWAVVTSGTTVLATARLEALGFPPPAALVTADDVARGKPDPMGYLAAAGALGVLAHDCVVIEDAPPGIEAARAAGMRAIAVTTTYAAEQLAAADVVCSTLEAVRLERVRRADGLPLLDLAIEPDG